MSCSLDPTTKFQNQCPSDCIDQRRNTKIFFFSRKIVWVFQQYKCYFSSLWIVWIQPFAETNYRQVNLGFFASFAHRRFSRKTNCDFFFTFMIFLSKPVWLDNRVCLFVQSSREHLLLTGYASCVSKFFFKLSRKRVLIFFKAFLKYQFCK